MLDILCKIKRCFEDCVIIKIFKMPLIPLALYFKSDLTPMLKENLVILPDPKIHNTLNAKFSDSSDGS